MAEIAMAHQGRPISGVAGVALREHFVSTWGKARTVAESGMALRAPRSLGWQAWHFVNIS